MASGGYTPDQLARNRTNIVLTAAAFSFVMIISGLIQSWPVSSFVAAGAAIAVCVLVFWKLFASNTAQRLPSDRHYARWPWWISKEQDDKNKKASEHS